MRLFIAINFTEENRRILSDTAALLRENSRKGNFTREENFHLTLAFLGDIPPSKVGSIRRVIDESAKECFDFQIRGLGCFRRQGGDIYWMGVEKKQELMSLADDICSGLRLAGFSIEDRAFKPHLTLGREVILNCDPKSLNVPSLSCHVHRISLMKSERISGVLTYTEIYGKELS